MTEPFKINNEKNLFSALKIFKNKDGQYVEEIKYLDSKDPDMSIIYEVGADLEQYRENDLRIYYNTKDMMNGFPIHLLKKDQSSTLAFFPSNILIVQWDDIEPTNLDMNFLDTVVDRLQLVVA